MKVHRLKIERGLRSRDALGEKQETVKPFDFDQEFEPLEAGLEHLLEKCAEFYKSPKEFWIALGYLKTFFPNRKDIHHYLNYDKVQAQHIKNAKTHDSFQVMTFYLMQLFPEKRKELLQLIELNPDEIPRKVFSGEAIFINELLMLSSAQPDQRQEYQDRASQELTAVKEWIKESLKFSNQERATLQLAANFLILCPQYKEQMQGLFKSKVGEIVDTLKSTEYDEWLQTLCNLEIIYGTDKFFIDDQGNLVRQTRATDLGSSPALPERLTA